MSVGSIKKQSRSRNVPWYLWSTVPIYPYGRRKTIRREVISERVWTFEQVQGIFYVVVPVRMTVVRLDEGGLLVYAPVAPTGECLQLLQELIDRYGDVKYVILSTISSLEHKTFVAPFAKKFPQALIYVPPDHWSFPIDLPLSWLGFPKKRTFVLPEDSSQSPFANQLDYAVLKTIDLRLGYFTEVAFFDKTSRSLLVTDSLVSIPAEPPPALQNDPYPLLFHAKESGLDPIVDTPENRRKGWQRICLFAMYFQPTVLSIPKWKDVFSNAFKAPNKSAKNYFGLFPFQWSTDWQQCFNSLSDDGRLFVAPILQTLILNRSPQEVVRWVDAIASWDFNTIIPCHFTAPITANPQQFSQAFAFLEPPTGYLATNTYPLPEAEFDVLKNIDEILCKTRLVPPPAQKNSTMNNEQ